MRYSSLFSLPMGFYAPAQLVADAKIKLDYALSNGLVVGVHQFEPDFMGPGR